MPLRMFCLLKRQAWPVRERFGNSDLSHASTYVYLGTFPLAETCAVEGRQKGESNVEGDKWRWPAGRTRSIHLRK
jgi:hypothetical protein